MKRALIFFAAITMAWIALPGCQEEEKPQQEPAIKQQLSAPSQPMAGGAPTDSGGMPSSGAPMAGGGAPRMGGGPMSGGGSDMKAEDALKAAPTLAPDLAPLKAAMDKAETAYKQDPKDDKLKAAYVDATYNYGHAAMEDGQKDPRVMYRAALALYRRALKVDPKHQPSLADKNMIESIYQQMGRPIPE